MNQPYTDDLAQLYDAAVSDWPGEIDFYLQLVREIASLDGSVLEVACGTGRVGVQLAATGSRVVGIDLSEDMLTIAKIKSTHLLNIRWMQADMRSFDLGEQFDLAIIPAYSFQLLVSENDQTSCLTEVARHLNSGSRFALHLEQHDRDWLASLPCDGFTPFEASGDATHPVTGQNIRVSYSWSKAPRTRSVAVIIRYETINESGHVVAVKDSAPLTMRCTAAVEMDYLLEQTGFETEAVYRDFLRHPWREGSDEMVWIARRT